MAEAKKAEKSEGGEGEQPAPKKKSKLILIIVAAVVVVLAIGGGVGYMLMSKSASHEEEEGDEAPAHEEKADAKHDAEAAPVYVKLDKFVVKLQTETQDAYLQAEPELRVLDAHLGDKIKQYNPEIRHKLLLILSGKKASEVSTPQGMQQLANEMRVTINGIVEPAPQRKRGKVAETESAPDDRAGPEDPVQAVLFTEFVIQ